MTDNNNILNEEQLVMVTGGTEESEKLKDAKHVLENCKMIVDFYYSKYKEYNDMQALETNVRHAYEVPKYDACKHYIRNALRAVELVRNVLPSLSPTLDDIKGYLLRAEEILNN